MTSKRWSASLVVALAACATEVLGVVACGSGNDSGSPLDASGTDATARVGPSDDASPSTSTDGAAAVSDGDSGNPGVGPADAANVPPSDAQVTADVDLTGLTAATFPRAVVTAFCAREQQCCGPGFDVSRCIDDTSILGGVNMNGLSTYEPDLVDAQVRLDPANAARCLSDNSGLPCGTVDSSTFLRIRNDCYAALVGLVPPNGIGCQTAIECAPSSFCVVPDGGDRGSGTCVPVLQAGAPCVSDDQCSYRGTGVPAQFCDNQGVDDDSGVPLGTNRCMAQREAGVACPENIPLYYDICTTGICNSNLVCDTTQVFSDPGVAGGTCASFAIQDAATE